jgi:hypothetical protein
MIKMYEYTHVRLLIYDLIITIWHFNYNWNSYNVLQFGQPTDRK